MEQKKREIRRLFDLEKELYVLQWKRPFHTMPESDDNGQWAQKGLSIVGHTAAYRSLAIAEKNEEKLIKDPARRSRKYEPRKWRVVRKDIAEAWKAGWNSRKNFIRSLS